MGHSGVALTLDTYPVLPNIQAAVEALGAALYGQKTEGVRPALN